MKTAHNLMHDDHDDQLAVTRRNINIHSYGVICTIMGKRTTDTLPLRLRCECPIPNCDEIIEIILSKRREVRREFPKGFIMVLAHAKSLRFKVLYTSSDYGVVEMHGFNQAVTDL